MADPSRVQVPGSLEPFDAGFAPFLRTPSLAATVPRIRSSPLSRRSDYADLTTAITARPTELAAEIGIIWGSA